jgi:succinate dehydrogenase / fumarate reductase cytochrome b subunit
MQGGNHNYFYLRRLHSLLGIFPIGVFLFEHFFSNSFAFQGAERFNALVETFQGMWITPFLEVGMIGLPILFHAVLGLVIVYTGSNNFLAYGYYRNWAYFFQRATGVLALIFIIVHAWSTRLGHLFDGRPITFDDMHAIFQPTWAKWFYAVGIISAVYHLTNGFATTLMTWGITHSQRSQKIVALAMWAAFVVMAAWGLLILRTFSSGGL